MDIEQSFHVPFSRATVWRSFQDAEGIVACLPGASLTEPPDDGKLKLVMAVKLGPIAAAFSGDGEMTLDDGTYAGRVTGGGSDRKTGSRAKGDAVFSLHAEPGAGASEATRVEVRVNYSMAGSLAQFSRGNLVQELAGRLTQAFAENLQRKLETESAAVAQAAGPDVAQPDAMATVPLTASAVPAAERVNQPLDLGQLFWPLLVARVRRLILFWRRA